MRRSSRVKAEVGKGRTTGPLNVRHSIQRVPGAPDTCGHIQLHHGTGSSFTHSMNRFVEYLLSARPTQMQLLHHTAPALMGKQTRSKEDTEFKTESFDGDWGQLGGHVGTTGQGPLGRLLQEEPFEWRPKGQGRVAMGRSGGRTSQAETCAKALCRCEFGLLRGMKASLVEPWWT